MSSPPGRRSLGLQRVLRQLPCGGSEQQAVEAGEVDAVIDYGSANVIVFPAAMRAMREAARRAATAAPAAAMSLPGQNGLLAALPAAEVQPMLPALEKVRLEFGTVLQEADAPIRYVHFPLDCVVCLLTPTDDLGTLETGLVGPEGMVGMPLATGSGASRVRAVVQVAGWALRMRAARFDDAFQRGPTLQRLLQRFAQAETDVARQTAACIASHRVEQRLACWLLMISDRARSSKPLLTHEHLAAVLNVRRVSVTSASGALRRRGALAYTRGRITILDRPFLEAAACECYRKAQAGSGPA